MVVVLKLRTKYFERNGAVRWYSNLGMIARTQSGATRKRLLHTRPWGRRFHSGRELETKLAELFSQLVGGEWPGGDETPYHPAVRAYGSILGSAARLTMIDEAAKAHFQWYPNPALEKRLKDFIGTECRNFATKRNNIAHGVVDLRFSDPPKLKIGYWLVPSLYASKKNPLKGPNAYAYTSVEIIYFIKEFDRLWIRASELISDIFKDQHRSP